MQLRTLAVYPIIILSMILWSFSFIWYKEVFVYYEPITVIFIRLVISSIFMITLNKILGKQQKIRRSDYFMMFLLSLFQPFFYFICESFGMKYVSSTIGAVLISTIPLFSPFVAYYIFKERLSVLNILGIIISFFGILLVLVNKEFELAASPKGILLMMLAVFAAIGYSAIVLKLVDKYNSFTIIAVQNTIGIFFFLPLFLIFDYKDFISVPFNWEAVKYLVYLAVFASSLAFVLFTYSIKILGISKANMFSNIIPVSTAIFAFFILDEELNTRIIIGILVVITGLFLSQINYVRFKLKRNYFFRKVN